MKTLTGHLQGGEAPPCHIYLNGLPQQDVSEAHTEEGWIVRAKRDAKGNLYVEGEEIATEKLFGPVTAVLVEDPE